MTRASHHSHHRVFVAHALMRAALTLVSTPRALPRTLGGTDFSRCEVNMASTAQEPA